LKIGATPVGLPEQWNIAFEHVSPGPKSCGVPPPTEDPQCRRSPAIGITSIEAVEGGSSKGRRARPFQAATVRGDTVDGTLDNIREAIELCLEDMQAHGEAIQDPSRVLVGRVVVTR
jgi:hypothetical protein